LETRKINKSKKDLSRPLLTQKFRTKRQLRRQLLPKPLRPTLMLHQDSPKLLLRTSLRMIKLMRKQKPTIRTKRKNKKETNPWKMKSQPPKWK